MKEEWLMPGAFIPVDLDTTKALVDEIKRLIGVIGGMALQQAEKREWVGLTDEELDQAWRSLDYTVSWAQHRIDIARAIEAKLMEKNT